MAVDGVGPRGKHWSRAELRTNLGHALGAHSWGMYAGHKLRAHGRGIRPRQMHSGHAHSETSTRRRRTPPKALGGRSLFLGEPSGSVLQRCHRPSNARISRNRVQPALLAAEKRQPAGSWRSPGNVNSSQGQRVNDLGRTPKFICLEYAPRLRAPNACPECMPLRRTPGAHAPRATPECAPPIVVPIVQRQPFSDSRTHSSGGSFR